MKYKELAIKNPETLIFGNAPKPVRTERGLVFGQGIVIPEVNLTVPEGTVINRQTLPELRRKYSEATRDILRRAVDLNSEGVVIELETLLEMTLEPDIGVDIVKGMNDVCEEFFSREGLKSEIRLTPNDTRDFDRPPKMRTGSYLDGMFELFERGAEAGGNLLSIETTGGKEVCDDALTMCDIKSVVFALSVLGVRDMRHVWKNIVAIAERTGRIAGGDTACGFGNTAMVLAEKHYIPRVFAAIVRVVTVIRSLVAIEEGAVGPDKDCGYEGVYLKAIAGIPISMEGKTAACAHLSPVGNIAAACADLWSNESVQNIKLLGGMAPTVYYEQLEYDCRLMNASIRKGKALDLRYLFVESDIWLDPQAFVLAPENIVKISKAIVSGGDCLNATVKGALKALELIEVAVESGRLKSSERENIWIPRIRDELESIPADEGRFIDEMLALSDPEKFAPSEYGL